MTEQKLFGFEIKQDGIEVVRRGNHLYVRYDAGSQIPVWREDEVTEQEAERIGRGPGGEYQVISDIQSRLGANAYVANWDGPKA